MKPKTEVRRELRGRVERLTREEKHAASAGLCRRLLEDEGLAAAGTIGVYLALPDEPDPGAALVGFLARGQRLALPVPEAESDWRFREIRDLTLTRKGPWGLSLPEPGDEIPVEDLDVILVPGRGFTSDGGRIGRGKGIYDRLLSGNRARTIGLAFGCQIVDTLPLNPHDIRLDEVWSFPV